MNMQLFLGLRIRGCLSVTRRHFGRYHHCLLFSADPAFTPLTGIEIFDPSHRHSNVRLPSSPGITLYPDHA